jgi:hypothetical protein
MGKLPTCCSRIGGVAAGTLLALALPAVASAEINRYLIDTGPLRIRDQFLPGMGFLAFDPVSADVLEAGRWQLDVVLTVSNDFAHSPAVEDLLEARDERAGLTLGELRAVASEPPDQGIFLIDAEHYRAAVALRRGMGHGLQLELVLPVIRFDGGLLDSTIESFHDTFGLGQAGRLGAPKDQVLIYVRGSERELFVDDAPGTALGDAVVGLRADLLSRRAPRRFELAVEGLVKLPTGDEGRLTGSGSADVGAQLLATRYFRRSCLHFAFGMARLGAFDRLGLDSQTVFSGMLAWEFSVAPTVTVLAQATLSESPFDQLHLEELDALSTQLTLGLKTAVGQRVFFFGITENLANFNNSPDVGFHFGVTRTFDGSRER